MKRIYTLISAVILGTGMVYAQIPNPDFETWNTKNTETLQDWISAGKVTKVTGQSGNAAQLSDDPMNTEGFSAIVYGSIGGSTLVAGGIPYVGRPDSLRLRVKHSLPVNDSAWVLVNLKAQGVPINFDVFRIGGTQSSFTDIRFALNYFIPFVQSDTVMIVITNTDPTLPQSGKGGYVAIDYIGFGTAGSSVGTLPNQNFENWTSFSFDEPEGWITSNTLASSFGSSTIAVTKSADAQHGSSAIRMENMNDTNLGLIPGAAISNYGMALDNETPAFPVPARVLTLTGFYKFQGVGGDNAQISINVFSQGEIVGTGDFTSNGNSATYQPFTISVNYLGSFTGMPDSASIMMGACENQQPFGESVLYVDNLDWTTNVSVNKVLADVTTMSYPNPAHDQAVIKFALGKAYNVEVKLFDMSGREISTLYNGFATAGVHEVTADVSQLTPGIYIYTINTPQGHITNKLTVE